MVDHIKAKYRKNTNPSFFNEFREPEIVVKTKCKPCIIINTFLTVINTLYVSGFVYLGIKAYQYKQNNLLQNPEEFNNNLNKIVHLLNGFCGNSTLL